jgi:thymidylate synthase (FAD)
MIDTSSRLRVTLVAKPQFLGVPPSLGTPREDQLQGPDAAKIIELAGRACYDSLGTGRNSDDYHKHILEVGHGSVLAHAVFTFFITGVSRGLSHELVRHAIGIGISQRSTRYVDESESPWIMHPLLAQYIDDMRATPGLDIRPELHEIEESIRLTVRMAQETYRLIVERLVNYQIENGVDKFNARKQARGAARGFLGNALETELIWSANVRALRWVISQRASAAADAEIRALGMELLKIGQRELPQYFMDYLISDSPDGLGECATSPNPKV